MIFSSFPIMCLDMIFFVIILHGVYNPSWICGLMFSFINFGKFISVLWSLLKASFSFLASQLHGCFQNCRLPHRQRGCKSKGWLTHQFLLDSPTSAISHCLWDSPKPLKWIFWCSVFLVLGKRFGPTIWWAIARSKSLGICS